jgi:NAD(P)-dependent dehydrogenase (short-subunit alcohol dehydrogenase family)
MEEAPTLDSFTATARAARGRTSLAERHDHDDNDSTRHKGKHMELGLQGKRALVTGATKGIGRAIAETLLAEGAAVAICARTAEDVDKAVAELSAQGTACGAAVDAGDTDAIRAWVASSSEQLGGIDIYVHNTSGKPARKLDGWVNNFNVDLMSLVHGVDAATPALTDGGGSVISIGTSATAEHFATGSNSYSAFKAAVTNWTLGQAQVLGAQGIRCNVVSPGPIFIEGGDWDMIKQHMGDFYAATEQGHPGKALGRAQDVADAVAFLVSERARHINGVNLTVDGGFLKRVDY